MISSLGKSVLQRLFAVAAILLLSLPAPQTARAQESDDIDQTVARISYIQGPVSYGRGDDPDDWDPALVNVPFTLGDRIYSSADGRAELQLPGGNFVRIGRRSYLNALTLTYDTKQFYLGNGAAIVNIRRLDPDEIFEIDTPNMAVTFDTPGTYRVEVDDDGNTRVVVRRGTAVVAANGRQVTVEQAEIRVYDTDSPQYEIVGLRAPDAFDRWVDERNDRFERAYSLAYQYADEEIVGVEDLAQYGRWEEIPDYGPAWTPTQVAVGWQPFTVGHYFWQDPWGWSWISEEPWGWAPCHYGRWTFYRSRWYWVPVRRRVEFVRYAPAVVEFVYVGGHVGWFPLHPRDRFVPWWGRSRRVEELTFVNRMRVVVIDQETFITGRRVSTRIVRDETILREVSRGRVHESLPIPRRESIRVTTERQGRVERPPANILSRQVVVRNAPLPPPPRFEEKQRVVQERKGQPLSPEEIQAMGAKNFKANQGVRIRPAAAGHGDFAPRNQSASTPASQPVTPTKGRKLATADAPVVTELPSREQRQQERQEKQVQEQRKDLQQIGKEPPHKDQERQKQDQERPQKQEQDRQKDQKQFQEQPRKDQEQDRRELERKQQEQERQKKQQEQDRQKQEKQLQEQQRKDQEQQKQQEQKQQIEKQKQDRQLEEQKRKEQQLQQQKQQRDEQQRKEQERQKQQDQDRQQRLQEQERQKQLQDQQRQQEQIQKDQQRQEQERRRQEQDRLRQEKQQQEQQRREQDQQGRELERQQKLQQEQARQKQIQEQRKQQQIRKEQPREDQRRQEEGQGAPQQQQSPPPR
jgi:hypothetical protein